MSSPARVLALLGLFDAEHPVWTTDAMNAALGYTRATGYRYVKELVEAGFLRKVSAGHYSLGARIIELDHQLRCSDPVLLAAVPVMDALAHEAGLDVVLTTMFGTKVVDTYRASADPALRLEYGRGRPRPLFRGAAPKVILAHQPRAQLVRLHEAHAAQIAQAGLGADWAEFRACLAAIRREGFYWSAGELEPGVGAAAVALTDAEGEPMAAVALVGRTEDLQRAGPARLRGWLDKARAAIEARLAERAGAATSG